MSLPGLMKIGVEDKSSSDGTTEQHLIPLPNLKLQKSILNFFISMKDKYNFDKFNKRIGSQEIINFSTLQKRSHRSCCRLELPSFIYVFRCSQQ